MLNWQLSKIKAFGMCNCNLGLKQKNEKIRN